MNWQKMDKIRAIIFSIFLFFLFPATGFAALAGPEEYFFQQGKEAFEHQDLWGAHYSFEEALYINPDHQGANLFYALTRILMISKSLKFNSFLTRAGMSTYGRDIFDWTADFPRDPTTGNIKLFATSPTGKEWQDFLKTDVLPQVDGALNNLSNVPNTYGTTFRWIVENGLGYYNTNKTFIDITKSWMPDEWAGYKLLINGTEYTIAGNTPIQITLTPESDDLPSFPSTFIYDIFGDLEIDYGDVLVLKGSLYMAKAMILALTSYDLGIDIDAIITLLNYGKLDIQSNIINTYRNLLNLLPTQQLSEAKSALREAINVFTQAINFVVGEPTGTTTPPTSPDPNQEDDLFIIETPEEEQEYRDLLTDLNNSLDGVTLIRKMGLDIDLGEFFDYPKNLRGYLPAFVGSSYIKRGSFPDPTFGGILPGYLDQDGITHRDMTREELEKRLEVHIRENYPIITPLVFYDDFFASKINTNKWRNGELVREIIKTGDYVYDNFSGANIDNKKWRQGDLVREILGGKLVLKHASSNPMMAPSFPYTTFNQLAFSNPGSANSIQADVFIVSNVITGSAWTRARLEGRFYNDTYTDGEAGNAYEGDIWSEVDIRWTSTGFRGWWYVGRHSTSDGSTISELGSGYFSTPITSGVTYPLYIGYASGANQFTFKIGGEVRTFTPPARKGDAKKPWKSLTTRVQIDDAVSSGYIYATFDNVYQSGLLYDNFTSTIINPAKWTTYEYAREIKVGKFRSKARSSEAYNASVDGGLYFEIPTTINSFQAKVTPLIYQNPEALSDPDGKGLNQTAGLWGVGYNDGTGSGAPGDRTGDVYGLIRIGGEGLKPAAEWFIVRCLNSGGTPEVLDSGTFSNTVALGSTHTLFVGWDKDLQQFTFKFDNLLFNKPAPVSAPVAGPINVPFAGLGTYISGQAPDKKEGSIEALFDDVTVIVGEDYKLLFKVASPNTSTVSVAPYYNADNKLSFPDPNSVNSIGADVRVLENIINGKAHTRARLAGFWYNDNTTPGAGSGAIGDVQGEIALRKEPTGFRVNWFIVRMTNLEGTQGDYITGGNFKAGVTTGVTYPLYVSYNSGTNEFRFKVGGEEVIVNQGNTPNLPDRSGPANTPWKEICTRVQIQDPGASGYISATFDNIYKNDVLYDAFPPPIIGTPPTIDETKWPTYESVKEISGGKFRSKVRSSLASTSSVSGRLEFLCPSEISAIQTKVTPLAYQNDQGASTRARIVGTFYNDGTRGADPKDRTGDVGAQIRIGGSGLTPVAEWNVYKTIDFAGVVPQLIASGTFTTPFSLGRTYTLFLGWDGIKFTFKIDNEVAYYEPETGVYPTYNPWRAIETQVFDPQRKEATMEALFDDVMVSGPLPSVSPASNNFGNVIAPTVSPVRIFTLLNTGSTSIGINSIDLVGNDASMFNIVSTTCQGPSLPLPARVGKCTVVASFQPTSPGDKSGALRFTLNTTGNPAIFMPLTGTGVLEKISTPTTPTITGGVSSGTTGTTYVFTTGGSSSSLGATHPIQYLFDWDDGTNSGWLPVGTKSATKIWTSNGTYYVKAMARCGIHKAVVSSLSSEKEVNIAFPIHPTSPVIGSPYNVLSLYPCGDPIPAFEWTVDGGEAFKSYRIQFSTDFKFRSISPVGVTSYTTTATIPWATWMSILLIPGKSGGVVYWRVVGTRSNLTTATSETSFILVGGPQPVSDAMFDGYSKASPPTLTWRDNYNRQFKVWVASDPDFSKTTGIKKYVLPVFYDDPCAEGGMFSAKLTASQWAYTYGVVNGIPGSTIWWYVESWDILGRTAKTWPMSFLLEP